MPSKKKNSFFRTLTFRLTLWYGGLFGVLGLVVFLVVYLSLGANLKKRTDEGLIHTATEFEALYDTHGIQALMSEFQREAHSRGIGRVFFRLLSPHGKALGTSDMGPWVALDGKDLQTPVLPEGGTAFRTISVSGHQDKVRLIFKRTAHGNVIQIGTTLRDNDLLMEKYRETFGTALSILLLCGGVVGWFMARQAMSGVRKVSQAASQIGKNDLSHRVSVGNEGQEIDDLARAFNEMLERIEILVRELKDVSDNIAHDLRSPITRIRGIAETTLTGKQSVPEYQEMAATVIGESDRLVDMINTMLEIAQTDSGVAEFSMKPVDMRHIIEDAADLFLPLAEDKDIGLKTSVMSAPLIVLGNRAKIQRVIANLLDNAIKFTPPGGKVMVSAGRDDSKATIAIEDTGTGILADDLPHIFERFYRCDKSRSTPGNGLGLSLALALVHAHGGDITVASSPGKGSAFTVSIPLIPPIS